MDATHARALAERLHAGDRGPDGAPLLLHVGRVVHATVVEARSVAWLHEALETGKVSEHALLAEGLTSDELRALRLLTRQSGARRDDAYLGHIELIARAAGWSGRLARAVKVADLEDRLAHPRTARDGWTPPYASGLRRLAAAGAQLQAAGAE